MKIAVIGTGNIGGTLARKLVIAGHNVSVANSEGRESVQQFADEIGVSAANVDDVAAGVEVVILAIPTNAMAALPDALFKSIVPDATVIDTSNYYPDMRDSRVPEIDEGMTESVWVSRQIGFPVVKAFKQRSGLHLGEFGTSSREPWPTRDCCCR